jgi:hypothetical protein
MKSKDLYDENFILIDHSLRIIHPLLSLFKEYYPIASILTKEGEVKDFNDFKHHEYIKCEELIDEYENILNTKLLKSEIKSYAIAYDVIKARDKTSELTNAIAIKIKNNSKSKSNVIYFSYKIVKGNKFEITDTWKETI